MSKKTIQKQISIDPVMRILKLNNFDIIFSGNNYVKASTLCKAGGRIYKDWKKGNRTDFLEQLSKSTGISINNLVLTYKNSSWLSPQVAIIVAQWIGSSFAHQFEKLLEKKEDVVEVIEKTSEENKPAEILVQRSVEKVLKLNDIEIVARKEDNYINATALCQAGGKKFNHWNTLETTQALIEALSADAGIPASALLDIKKGGNDKKNQGSWIHPDLAVHLAIWISPEFGLQVSRWICNLNSPVKRNEILNNISTEKFLKLNDIEIVARNEDNYINATALCQAGGKNYSNYIRNDKSESFLQILSSSLRIRRDELIQHNKGSIHNRATWVHPQVAINIAQWISPEFDVQVSKWIFDLLTTGVVILPDAPKENVKEAVSDWYSQKLQIEDIKPFNLPKNKNCIYINQIYDNVYKIGFTSSMTRNDKHEENFIKSVFIGMVIVKTIKTESYVKKQLKRFKIADKDRLYSFFKQQPRNEPNEIFEFDIPANEVLNKVKDLVEEFERDISNEQETKLKDNELELLKKDFQIELMKKDFELLKKDLEIKNLQMELLKNGIKI